MLPEILWTRDTQGTTTARSTVVDKTQVEGGIFKTQHSDVTGKPVI